MARLVFAALGLILILAPSSRLLAGEVDAGAGTAVAPPAAAGDPEEGRKVFANAGCGGCHTLADAGATGQVGPSLDGDPNLTPGFIVDRVTNGQGQMPAFVDQLSAQDIADVAAYVAKVAAK